MQPRRRHRIILGLLSLGLLAGVALTAHPAQAVDAVGPYYAEPAWDRKIVPVSRFVVLTNWNNEAVLDKETGLVWERSPATFTDSWPTALQFCVNSITGNRKGWRLPSMPELASLILPSGFTSPGPTLPVGHPFVGVKSGSTTQDSYWTATTNAKFPTFAWTVNFGGRSPAMDWDDKDQLSTSPHPIWCVRGGNNADVY